MKRGQICPTYAKAREDIQLTEGEESFFHGVKPAKTFACNKCCLLKKAREIIGVSAGKAATGRKAGKSSIGKMQKKMSKIGEKIGKILLSCVQHEQSLQWEIKRAVKEPNERT